MQGKVSVGLSTVTGYGVTTAAFVGAVLAYLGGDHSNQQLAIIACGVIGAISFMVTNIGRQRQATAITKYGGVITVPAAPLIDFDGDGVFTPAPQSKAGPVVDGPGDPLPHELADAPAPQGPVVDEGDGQAAPA